MVCCHDFFILTDKNRQLEGGIRYVGSEGMITCKYSGYQGRDITADPPEILSHVIKPSGTHLYTCPEGPERNFLDCVKSRRDTYYPAEVGHRTATVCHIGHIAMVLREELQLDPMAEQFVNNHKANRHLSREMQSPWKL